VTATSQSSNVVGLGFDVLRKRGFQQSARKVGQYLAAKWYLRKATSLGTVLLEGRALVVNGGLLRFGDHVRLNGTTVRLEFVCYGGGRLELGDGTFVNYGTNMSAMKSVVIGQNCSIGQYSIIMDCDHHDISDHGSLGTVEPVMIEDDVWLGARTIVLKGSHIGRGSVIGANSVVKGFIPPYSLAAGSPARVIRNIEHNSND
jgi:acetyltransferase-like isoleucine patch superfamily enzyme